jgi:hypothetical protein
MATFRQNLIARRDAIGVELAAVQNTDRHIQYKQGLYEELLAIQQLLESSTIDQTSSDTLKPFEIETRGLT